MPKGGGLDVEFLVQLHEIVDMLCKFADTVIHTSKFNFHFATEHTEFPINAIKPLINTIETLVDRIETSLHDLREGIHLLLEDLDGEFSHTIFGIPYRGTWWSNAHRSVRSIPLLSEFALTTLRLRSTICPHATRSFPGIRG